MSEINVGTMNRKSWHLDDAEVVRVKTRYADGRVTEMFVRGAKLGDRVRHIGDTAVAVVTEIIAE